MKPIARVLAVLVVGVAACGDDVGDASGSTSGATGGASTGSVSDGGSTGGQGESSSSSGAVDGTGSTDGSSGGTKLDLAVPDTRPPPTGCDKVDLLFVIDNSGSMFDHQQSLLAAFGLFMEQIQGTLQAQDYHVMVVDSDADEGIAYCQNQCDIMGAPCMGFPCGVAATECDGTLGAGVTQPWGASASNAACGFPAPARYLSSGVGDLVDSFTCAGTVGISGSGNEKNMNAMLAAVGPVLAAPGACNEGFVRADAVLVVVLLSDATHTSSQEQVDETPQQWHDELVALKGGYDGAIAMLGLVSDSDLENGLCQPNPIPADQGSPRLRELVELFGERGILASICEPDYQPFFTEAVAMIDATCDEFVPRG